MKAKMGILLLLSLACGAMTAQELSYDNAAASSTNTTTDTFEAASDPDLRLDFSENLTADVASDEAFLERGLRLSGPAVGAFKAKSIFDFPLRLLQLINPFARTAATVQPLRVERDSRAWTTIVGWNPGQSAFADDTHHEPQLRLISFSTSTGR